MKLIHPTDDEAYDDIDNDIGYIMDHFEIETSAWENWKVEYDRQSALGVSNPTKLNVGIN